MNVGTPYVESLTGYIGRLAQAHCVSPGRLIAKNLPAVLPKNYVATIAYRDRDIGRLAHLINGMRVMARDWVQALERLTLRRDLGFLTMQIWGAVISPIHLFHLHRTWCPACYEEWATAGQVIYEPLLWTIHAVTICVHHQRRLSWVCSHCDRPLAALASRSRPGHCERCGQWLGIALGAERSRSDRPNAEELSRQTEVVHEVGELLGAAPELPAPPTREMLRKGISLGVEQRGNGSQSAFAALIQTTPDFVGQWLKGNKNPVPTLAKLLRIAQVMGVPLLNLLIGKDMPAPSDSPEPLEPTPSPNPSTAHPQKKRYHWEDMKQALETALNQEDSLPTIAEIANRLGFATIAVYKAFPTLCLAITAKRRGRSKQRYLKAEPVLRAALEENPPPSLAKMARRLDIPKATLVYHMPDLCRLIVARRAAYQKERRERKRQALQAALNEYPPPSMSAMVKRIGDKHGRDLHIRFPDLCAAIAARYAEYKKAHDAEAKRTREEKILQIARDLMGKGEYPSLRRIQKALGRSAHLETLMINRIRHDLGLL